MERTPAETHSWVSERLKQEQQAAADTAQPESARDAANGAADALQAFTAYLDGDDKA